jgi:hypothetical protein
MIKKPNSSFWAHNTLLAIASIAIALPVTPPDDLFTVIMSIFFIWFVVYSVARPEALLFYPAYLGGVVMYYIESKQIGILTLFILGVIAIAIITFYEETEEECVSDGNGGFNRRTPYMPCIARR